MLTYNQWKKDAEITLGGNYRIADDLLLLQSSELIKMEVGPFMSDMIIAIILKSGTLKLTIDMIEYEAASPCLIIILPKQTFRITELPDDLDGKTIMMSNEFSDSLFNEYAAFNQLRKTVETSPVTYLIGGIKEAFDTYLKLLEDLINSPVKAYKLEAAKHLTLSMFYGIVLSMHDLNEVKPTDRQGVLFKQFERELRLNYKREREVSFYADKLCITPKYLSAIVLEQTGKSALKVINEYVTNECQALLLSTNLTLQQISDKLNFPSQAIFSKFFKRMTGLSPRDYRKQIL